VNGVEEAPRRDDAPRAVLAEVLRTGADDGAGTVLALGLVAVVGCLLAACVALGSAVVARHRAAAAADLAALAAADRTLGRASGLPCPAAGAVATADDATVTSCAVAPDGSVTVEVAVRLPRPWGRLGVARAEARAGRPP
jgi:secretion/DNA translocation related TadE-like protein